MARIVGTSGRDVLRGTSHRDVIIGKGGNDKIIGRGGNDKLKGNGGNDKLIGGNGNDKLNGGAGNDKLDAGNGNDKLKGGAGNDKLDAGPGVDDIFGEGGADIFRFERGDGLWPSFPGFWAVGERNDNIIFDYQDGIDKFDVPDADLDLMSPATFGPLYGPINRDFDDPVGGSGAAFGFGEDYNQPFPGINNPSQNTFVFVAGITETDFDAGDFI